MTRVEGGAAAGFLHTPPPINGSTLGSQWTVFHSRPWIGVSVALGLVFLCGVAATAWDLLHLRPARGAASST